jgi:hypothetical protein
MIDVNDATPAFWSVPAAKVIELVIRTRRPFFPNSPSKPLLVATLLAAGVTLLPPGSPLPPLASFRPLLLSFIAVIAPITVLYVVAAEAGKAFFYRSVRD